MLIWQGKFVLHCLAYIQITVEKQAFSSHVIEFTVYGVIFY